MSRQNASLKLRIAMLGALLVLGGCSTVEEIIWPPTPVASQTETGPAGASSAMPHNTDDTGLQAMSRASSGTAVGMKVVQIRSELGALRTRMNQQNNNTEQAQAKTRDNAVAYHSTKAVIEAALQVGTTPGNPVLLDQWNRAQVQLDAIAQDVSNMASLANAIAADATTATYLLETAQATLRLSGAVDEDHARLEVLQTETRQMVVFINQLLRELREAAARQTTYLANERSNLTTLSNAIKRGQLFGRSLVTPLSDAAPAKLAAQAKQKSLSAPLVVIHFDKPDVEYERDLYTALSQALERIPGARFTVQAVYPSRGNAVNVQLSQSQSRQNAEKVFRSMGDMGLPAERVELSSVISGDVKASQVRIFIR